MRSSTYAAGFESQAAFELRVPTARHPMLGTACTLYGGFALATLLWMALMGPADGLVRPTVGRLQFWCDFSLAAAGHAALLLSGVLMLGRLRAATGLMFLTAALSVAHTTVGLYVFNAAAPQRFSQEAFDRVALAAVVISYLPAVLYVILGVFLALPTATSQVFEAERPSWRSNGRRAA